MKLRKCNLSVSKLQKKYTSGCRYSSLIQTKNSSSLNLRTLFDGSEGTLPSSESITFFHARQLFADLSQSSVLSATSIITRFSRQQCHDEAIYLFSRMLGSDCRPNEFTFGTIIPSATSIKSLRIGKQLHGCVKKLGFHSNVFVGSALLDLYVKLSDMDEAQRVFEEIEIPNVVSYTTLITGLFKKERIEDARQVFDEMPEKNIVSWNSMIGGFSQTGHNEEAVNLFIEMMREGLVPTQSTFPCAISAAANIASLGIGQSFHACSVKFLGKLDVFVGNSLISFYAKCGSMEDSLLVFNKMEKMNIVSWNAIICGYAQNGKGEEAICFFQKMNKFANCKPNSVTLLGLLWACNHAGFVDRGYLYFNQARIKDPYMLKPEHYACMVDLLARSGRFKQAKSFISDLPFDPGIGFWKALLGGCQIHSNMELGELAVKKILELDPGDVSSFVMMSNAHSLAGQWENVLKIRKEMKEKGMKRVPGCSWIEIRSKVHVFVTCDSSHYDKDHVYEVLGFCIQHLRESDHEWYSSVDY